VLAKVRRPFDFIRAQHAEMATQSILFHLLGFVIKKRESAGMAFADGQLGVDHRMGIALAIPGLMVQKCPGDIRRSAHQA